MYSPSLIQTLDFSHCFDFIIIIFFFERRQIFYYIITYCLDNWSLSKNMLVRLIRTINYITLIVQIWHCNIVTKVILREYVYQYILISETKPDGCNVKRKHCCPSRAKSVYTGLVWVFFGVFFLFVFFGNCFIGGGGLFLSR